MFQYIFKILNEMIFFNFFFRDRIADNTKYTAQAWIYTEKIFRFTRPELFHSNTTTGNFRERVFTSDKRYNDYIQ